METRIFPQDYEIRIKHDIHGEPYWEMLKKGEPIVCDYYDLGLLVNTLGKLICAINEHRIRLAEKCVLEYYGSEEEAQKGIKEYIDRLRNKINEKPPEILMTHIHKTY